jgi:hypothetical protein
MAKASRTFSLGHPPRPQGSAAGHASLSLLRAAFRQIGFDDADERLTERPEELQQSLEVQFGYDKTAAPTVRDLVTHLPKLP